MLKHGGNLLYFSEKYGIDKKSLIDLSSNTVEPESALFDDLDYKFLLSGLFSETPYRLRDAISKKFSLDKEKIIAGSGSLSLIKDLCMIFSKREALIYEPAFSEYEILAKAFDMKVDFRFAKEEKNFEFELLEINHDIVFICNPNNPTGGFISPLKLSQFIEENKDTFFVVDESYIEFASDTSVFNFAKSDNFAVLRSFSKLYGLAGARVGWLYTPNSEIIEKLNRINLSWSVSALAEELAIRALDLDYSNKIAQIVNVRDWLREEMKKSGYVETFESKTNFLLFKLKRKDSAWLFDKMIKEGFLIRDCSNFRGLSDKFFRISIKDKRTTEKFLNSFLKVYGRWLKR
ncbi:pyridoxal phosphate-dependent aminotransferase [Hippea alviniae]|uniref:pyridoxal phosphate-dependent aminotransferase n=1 Tax=Hippea alviniae TaxID=1279027 RepID=UPI0003B383B3|nr:histidinol-phosphate transaminase [Hippea alviniae]